MKGDAAERGALQASLGRSDKICTTVAYAESYVLMLLFRDMNQANA